MTDFLKIYNLEKYLFEDVGAGFRSTGQIDHADFFMIIIWKSNRAKTKVRDKLKRKANGDFSAAVATISKALFSARKTPKEQLAILMRDWELRLPMASAILTVLYPDEFTIYDKRVCGVLNFPYKDMPFSDDCWSTYERYKREVCNNAPLNLSLRNRDRYLWGKSFFEDATRDAR
jgi:hypothetical protein